LLFITILSSCGSSGSKNGSGSEAPVAEASASTSSEAAAPVVKKYGIKSGIVTFESKGLGITSKVVLYFDDFGSKEAEEKYDENNNIKESSLCDGKNRYTIIYKEKAAYNQGECNRGVAYRFDWEGMAKADPEYKVKKLANISVAEKDCESFSMESSGNTMTYAGWNNICLLLDQTTQYGDITYRAVSFEENPPIPAGKLNVPEGFQMK
jgi:hypothetical protein